MQDPSSAMFGGPARPAAATSPEPSVASTQAEPSVRTEKTSGGRIDDPVLWFVLLVGLAMAFGWIGASLEITAGRS